MSPVLWCSWQLLCAAMLRFTFYLNPLCLSLLHLLQLHFRFPAVLYVTQNNLQPPREKVVLGATYNMCRRRVSHGYSEERFCTLEKLPGMRIMTVCFLLLQQTSVDFSVSSCLQYVGICWASAQIHLKMLQGQNVPTIQWFLWWN